VKERRAGSQRGGARKSLSLRGNLNGEDNVYRGSTASIVLSCVKPTKLTKKKKRKKKTTKEKPFRILLDVNIGKKPSSRRPWRGKMVCGKDRNSLNFLIS